MGLSTQTPSVSVSLTLLGCGKMGSSMLSMWQERGILSQVHVIDPSPLPNIFEESSNVSHSSTYSGNTPIDSDVLIIAVKPQIMEKALIPLAQYVSHKCCVISIAAGKSLSVVSSFFEEEQSVIRVMPNTPAAVGKGVSAAIANKNTTAKQRKKADMLLEPLGALHWIEDETLMNAVTALSGCGPAYLFYLIEVLAKAGQSIGIPVDLAETIARQTIIGSAALAEKDSYVSASTLRENVTSPGGATQEALKILMNGDLEALFCDALKAARERGEELGK